MADLVWYQKLSINISGSILGEVGRKVNRPKVEPTSGNDGRL